MALLLDTHVFLWLVAEPKRLPTRIRKAIDETESVYLSVASAWEIALKTSLGKLELPGDPRNFVVSRLEQLLIAPLAISLSHAAMVTALPFHHRDPFDRLLAAQALCDDLTFVSRDRVFAKYGVRLLA